MISGASIPDRSKQAIELTETMRKLRATTQCSYGVPWYDTNIICKTCLIRNSDPGILLFCWFVFAFRWHSLVNLRFLQALDENNAFLIILRSRSCSEVNREQVMFIYNSSEKIWTLMGVDKFYIFL